MSLMTSRVDQPPMLPAIEPLEGIGSLSARQCGQCHDAIYDEWRQSLMAVASVNPFYVAESAEQGHPFVCQRCHAPLENQTRVIVDGLLSLDPLVGRGTPNANFDSALEREGVTCVVCHMSPQMAYWPDTPPSIAPTIFSARALPDAKPPHPLAVGPALGDAARGCARCHQIDPPGANTLRPASDTMREYADYLAGGGEQTCVGCHMPEVRRPSAKGGPMRLGHRHRFSGARDAAFIERFLDVAVMPIESGVRVVVTNRAGHRVPTGEPSRVLYVNVSLKNGEQTVAQRSVRLQRSMDTVHLIERFDTSLKVGETRAIDVPFSDVERVAARRVEAWLGFARYAADHPLVVGMGGTAPRPLGVLVTVVTATINGSL